MRKETLAQKVKAIVELGIRQRKKVLLFEHLILMVHIVKLCLGISYMKLSAASFLSLSEFKLGGSVAKSYLTLFDPKGCNLPGFSVHGISQARILEWVAISFCTGYSQPRD